MPPIITITTIIQGKSIRGHKESSPTSNISVADEDTAPYNNGGMMKEAAVLLQAMLGMIPGGWSKKQGSRSQGASPEALDCHSRWPEEPFDVTRSS